MPLYTEKCPLCKRSTKDNKVICESGKYGSKFKMVQCSDCQLFYQQFYFTLDESKKYYRDVYFSTDRKTFKINDINCKNKFKFDLKRQTSKFRKQVVDIIDTLPKGRVLEIGAGAGRVSLYLKEKGFDIEAIEVSKDFRSVFLENGIKLYIDFFEKLDFGEQSFDYVIAIEVIEHLVDPVLCVEKIRKILKDDGILLIETPVAPDGLVPFMKSPNFNVYPFELAHFTIFNNVSLKKLFSGFDLSNFTAQSDVPFVLKKKKDE